MKDEDRVKELIQMTCDFYGLTEEDLKNWNKRPPALSNIRAFIFCKLVNYWGYTHTEAGRVLSTDGHRAKISINKLENSKELMTEFLNVFGKEDE